MRLVWITPGAGEGYDCANCLRDTSLCLALRQAGHTVEPVTLYLPPVADRPEERLDAPMFYGGINVYLQQHTRLFRRTPRFVDRLLDSPLLLAWAARRAGMTAPEELGRTTISILQGAEGHQAKELQRLLDHLAGLPRPDVICLSNLLLAGLAAPIKQALGVPVACLLQDEDHFLDELGELAAPAWMQVSRRTQEIDCLIAASDWYARQMQQRLGLPALPPAALGGIHLDGWRASRLPLDPPLVGACAPLQPHGGFDLLVEAAALLRERGRPIRLALGQVRGPVDPAFVATLHARIEELGLTEETALLQPYEREERIAFFESLTVLAAPTRRPEAFGRHLLEALAAGVPVLCAAHGGFVELVEQTGGGRLVQPGDAAALAGALEELLGDAEELQRLGRAGRRAVQERFTLEQAAARLSGLLERMVGQ